MNKKKLKSDLSDVVEKFEEAKDKLDSIRLESESSDNWDLVDLVNEYIESTQSIIDEISDFKDSM